MLRIFLASFATLRKRKKIIRTGAVRWPRYDNLTFFRKSHFCLKSRFCFARSRFSYEIPIFSSSISFFLFHDREFLPSLRDRLSLIILFFYSMPVTSSTSFGFVRLRREDSGLTMGLSPWLPAGLACLLQ